MKIRAYPEGINSADTAITEKVRLGTSVIVAPLRNPIQLAKSLGSLDHMSRGRLTVGLGLGGNPNDIPPFGISADRRYGIDARCVCASSREEDPAAVRRPSGHAGISVRPIVGELQRASRSTGLHDGDFRQPEIKDQERDSGFVRREDRETRHRRSAKSFADPLRGPR